MASGDSCPCRSPRRNLPPINPVEDALAREPGLVGGPHSSSTSFATVPTNKLFKNLMKAYLESNQEPRQPPVDGFSDGANQTSIDTWN